MIISCLLYSSCAALTTSLQSDQFSPLNITKRNEGIINGLFSAYACRINKVLELVQNKLALSRLLLHNSTQLLVYKVVYYVMYIFITADD